MAPMTVDELLSNLPENAPKDKPLFYRVYKAAIQVFTLGSGVVDGKKLTQDEANKVIDYYIKIFREKYCPVLMDKGIDRTGQGTRMEYSETTIDDPTYVGLDSCIGITVPGKFGVHLVIPVDGEDYKKIYVERVTLLRAHCGDGQKIIICGKSEDAIWTHIGSISEIFHYGTAECPAAITWLLEKISDGEYEVRTSMDGIVTY